MLKPISKRLDWQLMAFKSGKAPKAKAATAKTVYGNTNQSTFGSDFGTGTSSIDPNTGLLSTTSSLSPGLKQANETATTGLNSNLSYLARDPNAIFGDMQAGNDPFYNVLQTNTQRANDANIAAARLRGAATGNNNSTTLGSTLGRISNEGVQQQNQNLVNAFTFGNDNARQNAGVNQAAITGLANLAYPLGSAANSNLLTALGARDQNSQYNASNQQQVNLANQQAQIAQQQANSAMWGNLLNGGLTAAGFALGGPLGASLGSAAGSMFKGGGGTTMGGGLGGGSGVSLPMSNFNQYGGSFSPLETMNMGIH